MIHLPSLCGHEPKQQYIIYVLIPLLSMCVHEAETTIHYLCNDSFI